MLIVFESLKTGTVNLELRRCLKRTEYCPSHNSGTVTTAIHLVINVSRATADAQRQQQLIPRRTDSTRQPATMKNLTAKQEARLEKKKKKIAALTEIIKLNDRDRRKKTPSQSDENSSDDNNDSRRHRAEAEALKRPSSQVSNSDDNDQRSSPQPMTASRKRAIKSSDTEVPEKTHKADQPDAADLLPEAPAVISTLDYAAMKRSLNARRRVDRSVPKIRLKLMGDLAALSNAAADRTPIFLTDVQHLVMGTVLGQQSPCVPYRWCHIERSAKVPHVVVLIVDGCSLYDFTANESAFEFCGKHLANKLEVVLPADGHVVEELVQVPLTDGQSEELIEKYGSLEAAMESTRNQMLLVQTVFPVQKAREAAAAAAAVKSAEPAKVEAVPVEVVPRTQLLLSALQLVDEGYPIPLNGELANRYRGYVMTSDSYLPVTERSPMFGLDCEMCRTSAGINELTRISIIDEQFESVYETLVRPDNKIVDYLTQYSGITGAMMLNVTKTRREVQQEVRALLPADAILVGQSLQSDLVAMQMMHPYVIDTSCIFNLSSERRIKSKLQALSLQFLGEVIQDNPLGHDSIEDCSASLKLTKLKMARGVDFGDAILSGRRRANEAKKQQQQLQQQQAQSTAGGETTAAPVEAPAPAAAAKRKRRSTMVISSAETGVNYGDFVSSIEGLASQNATKNIQCEQTDSNRAAIRRTQELAIQHDLIISHVRLQRERVAEPESAAAELAKVDRWIAKCWESVAANGLLIVMLGTGTAVDAGAGVGAGSEQGGGDGGDEDKKSKTGAQHSGVVMFDIKPSSAVGSNAEYRQ